jgi:hypothetical protein
VCVKAFIPRRSKLNEMLRVCEGRAGPSPSFDATWALRAAMSHRLKLLKVVRRVVRTYG